MSTPPSLRLVRPGHVEPLARAGRRTPSARRFGAWAWARTWARVGSGLLGVGAWAVAFGQPGMVAAGPPKSATAGAVELVEPASDEPEVEMVVLVTVDSGEDEELGVELFRAIATELNDVPVRLELRASIGAAEPDRGDRLSVREAWIREAGAAGLVAIEIVDRGLELELVVADAGLLRRPRIELDAIAGGPAVGIEAAAVIVRHWVVDLISGRPIALTPSEPSDASDASELRPPATPRSTSGDEGRDEGQDGGRDEPGLSGADRPTLGDRGRLRVQLGYLGQAWLRERAWDNGVELGLGWRFAVGAHLGLAAGFGQPFAAELVHPDNRGVAQLRVHRYPVALAAGYQHLWARSGLALDAQLRVGVEVLERGVFDPAGISPRLDRPVILVPTVEPRLALEYLVIGPLAVFVALGARANLVRVDYRLEYVDADGAVVARERPLTPRAVAPVVVAGLDMFF
jgi:hypothetical protein